MTQDSDSCGKSTRDIRRKSCTNSHTVCKIVQTIPHDNHPGHTRHRFGCRVYVTWKIEQSRDIYLRYLNCIMSNIFGCTISNFGFSNKRSYCVLRVTRTALCLTKKYRFIGKKKPEITYYNKTHRENDYVRDVCFHVRV